MLSNSLPLNVVVFVVVQCKKTLIFLLNERGSNHWSRTKSERGLNYIKMLLLQSLTFVHWIMGTGLAMPSVGITFLHLLLLGTLLFMVHRFEAVILCA